MIFLCGGVHGGPGGPRIYFFSFFLSRIDTGYKVCMCACVRIRARVEQRIEVRVTGEITGRVQLRSVKYSLSVQIQRCLQS